MVGVFPRPACLLTHACIVSSHKNPPPKKNQKSKIKNQKSKNSKFYRASLQIYGSFPSAGTRTATSFLEGCWPRRWDEGSDCKVAKVASYFVPLCFVLFLGGGNSLVQYVNANRIPSYVRTSLDQRFFFKMVTDEIISTMLEEWVGFVGKGERIRLGYGVFQWNLGLVMD